MVLLRRRHIVFRVAFLAAIGAGVITLAGERTWRSRTMFMPQARRMQSNLSGIAAQIGLNIPLGEGSMSPAFYADLIRTSTILQPVVRAQYRTRANGASRSLPDILEVGEGDATEVRLRKAEAKLQRMLNATVSPKSGVVTLDVRAPDPVLANALSLRILAQVDTFNLVTRRSQAGAERRFSEDRVQATRAELRAAEDRLQAFLQRNRAFRNSPELTFQEERLRRDVQLRQDVYTQLVQALEQAKLDEVRDTPVLSIIEAPSVAAVPEPRGVVTSVIVAFVLGSMLGVVLALAIAALRGERAGDDAAGDARLELRRLVGDLRAPWRLLSA